MTDLKMVCTCDAEHIRKNEARRIRALNVMRLSEMKDLTSAVILSLAFDFSVHDFDVDVDQWFAVGVRTPLLDDWLYVECDYVADGVLALWEKLALDFPNLVSIKRTGISGFETAENISASLLNEYKEAKILFQDHLKPIVKINGVTIANLYWTLIH